MDHFTHSLVTCNPMTLRSSYFYYNYSSISFKIREKERLDWARVSIIKTKKHFLDKVAKKSE